MANRILISPMKLTAFIFLILLFATSVTHAHPGGHGGMELTPSQAKMVAYSVIQQFIQHDPGLGFGKLDKSWSSLPEAAKAIYKTDPEYFIIGFTNSNKTLYVLISITGDVYDANFSGEFEGLK